MFTPLPVRTARSGWTFYFIHYGKDAYNDAPLTTGAIIQLLKSRGLTFKDETKASHLLDHISYFRFKSYLLPLLHNKQTGMFKGGATFEDAYTLYKFDSALRKLICAHHSRLWNKTLRVTGGFPKHTAHGFITTRVQNDKVYYVLCIIRYMLLTINPNSSFTSRLRQLLKDYPSVDIKAMGFPSTWETEPLWHTK